MRQREAVVEVLFYAACIAFGFESLPWYAYVTWSITMFLMGKIVEMRMNKGA